MKFLLCDEFMHEVNDNLVKPYDGANVGTRKLQVRPYTHYLLSKRLDIARNLWCLDSVLKYIPPGYVDCAVDYFAGIGCSSRVLWERLALDGLVSMDLDENCVGVLRESLPFAEVQQTDFYECAGNYITDLALLDVETFTILQLDARMMDALRRVVDTSEFVILPDTAVAKYWLNIAAYDRVFRNASPDLKTYMGHMATYMFDNFGMSLMVVSYHTRAAYMLFQVDGDVPSSITMEKCSSDADNYFRELVS